MLEHYNIDIVKTLTVGDYPPPAMLVKLIDELPVGSRYVAKKLGDNRFLGRTRDTVVLEDTYDLIQALMKGLAGGKVPIEPYPRPKAKTAEDVRRESEGLSLRELVSWGESLGLVEWEEVDFDDE
jgi:hypothetical protein|uniref:Uncharacterized protein n=1 Tax=Phage sp. ctesc4 TaxID=2828008 RepID=A0A8S5TCN6_9VIRU|nr:MAG TPA: protein of unknown function (DUF5361) [Phage sp. ctesc4]DAR31504.1 MAG TPA: protein of unknown function (DUF5361) [Caudoviricetes sp.]